MKVKEHAVCNKIRSVKSWLSLAEDSFIKENDIRGELNLLLAEAEFQHLREKESINQKRSRQIIAFLTAIVLLLCLFGGWTAYNQYRQGFKDASLQLTNLSVQNLNSFLQFAIETDRILPKEIKQMEKEVVYRTQLVEQEVQTLEHSSKEQVKFTENEVRSLVRTAGNTLRGK